MVREVDAPPEDVWRAWSEPDQIRRWWGPTGFTCPRADVDLRVGGSTLVTMQAPPEYGGGQIHNRWTFTAVVPPHRLEFVSTFADADGRPITPAALGIPAGVPDEVPHLVLLEPLPDGRTRLRVVEQGYTDESARSLSEAGQQQCLDKMQELFGTAR
ncbi:SRPBCC domain-containing protein [Microlunatus lacustris]